MSTEDGQRFAKEHGLMFFETSALTSDNVETLFSTAAKNIYDGILTNKFDADEYGEIVGIKEGNVELTKAQRNQSLSKVTLE